MLPRICREKINTSLHASSSRLPAPFSLRFRVSILAASSMPLLGSHIRNGSHPGDGWPEGGCKAGSSLLALPDRADADPPDESTLATKASAAFTICGTPSAWGNPAACSSSLKHPNGRCVLAGCMMTCQHCCGIAHRDAPSKMFCGAVMDVICKMHQPVCMWQPPARPCERTLATTLFLQGCGQLQAGPRVRGTHPERCREQVLARWCASTPDSVGWLAARLTRSIMDCRRMPGAGEFPADGGPCAGTTGGRGRPGPLPTCTSRSARGMRKIHPQFPLWSASSAR